MCGICGVVATSGNGVETAVRRMMTAMRHRGPDDEGYEAVSMSQRDAGPMAGLGFRRLAILDLSPAGHQPMVNPRTGDWLIFNGEIYNYRSLHAQLRTEGVECSASGDTAVLLKALSTWGDLALQRLEGMYAFAFYQASSRRILLARDPVGIKPLYVAATHNRLVFASEVRAVLASGLVSSELDPAGIAGYLAYGAPQDPLTVHKAIRSFPCGTYQWCKFDTDSDELLWEPSRRFWRFPERQTFRSIEAAAAEVKNALTAAVGSHLVSDVPMSFFLSAGIDSTAIAALAAKQAGRIRTCTVGFDSPSMRSELSVAAETARGLGSDHTEIVLSTDSIGARWHAWLDAADRPCVDGFNTFIISGAVKQAGSTVALSGLGADELFGGYSSFRRVRRLARLMRWAQWLPLRTRRTAANAVLPCVPKKYRSKFRSLSESAATFGELTVIIRQFLDPAMIHGLGLAATGLGLRSDLLSEEATETFLDPSDDAFVAISRAETYQYMANTLLRDSDNNSMAWSVELRVPFLARMVLETAGRLPSSYHESGGLASKSILRLAIKDLVPPEVFQRPKTGFTLPLSEWMFGELRESCEHAVASLKDVPFLNSKKTTRLWDDFVRNREHNYWMKPMILVALGHYVANLRARKI